MFSHVMVGSNDIARSKKFYDAVFVAMGGKPGMQDAKGRLIYVHNGGVVPGEQTDRWQGGHARQRRHDRLHDGEPGTSRRLAQGRSRERRDGDRGPARHSPGRRRSDVSRLPARS